MKKILILSTICILLFITPSMAIQSVDDSDTGDTVFHWGVILFQKYSLYPRKIMFLDAYDNRYFAFEFNTYYNIIGIGRHTVRSEWRYDMYSYDWCSGDTVDFNTIIHWNYTKDFTEDIYLFDIFRGPHVKLRARNHFSCAMAVLINGTAESSVYIDDQLVWEDSITLEDQDQFQNPYIYASHPVNGSYVSDLQPECRLYIDYVMLPPTIDKPTVNVSWYENSTGSWVLRQTDTNVEVGNLLLPTCIWNYTQANRYNQKYWWKVVVDDGINVVTETYHFITRFTVSNPFLQISGVDIVDFDDTLITKTDEIFIVNQHITK